MSRWRAALIALGAVVVLGMSNMTILRKQAIVDDGRQILLRLAPVDPRSLMQGDYMRLRYEPELYPDWALAETLPWDGTVVLALDSDGVARFARLDDGGALAPDEVRLGYRLRGWAGSPRYGAESYFFQEGEARRFAQAEFGVLRVDADGNSVLVGLADENRQLIAAD